MKIFNKYHNRKTKIDGFTFDSKKEATRYCELKILAERGDIHDLLLQPKYELQPHFKHNGKMIRKIEYIADFSYFDNNGVHIVEDVKGMKTDVFKIKEKMFKYKYPEIEFRIIR